MVLLFIWSPVQLSANERSAFFTDAPHTLCARTHKLSDYRLWITGVSCLVAEVYQTPDRSDPQTTNMSERFLVVPVAHAVESAFGGETDGDSVLDAGGGEGERAERRGSVPILQYSREPNKYGETAWDHTDRKCRSELSHYNKRRAVMFVIKERRARPELSQ